MDFSERDAKRFWGHVERPADESCWLWRNAAGYGQFSLHGKNVSAHRASWELANGQIDSGSFVCHTCDNPPCVNPSHLFLGSNSDNIKDSVSKGRSTSRFPVMRGEDHYRARITEQDVKDIRRLTLTSTDREVGKVYGLAESTVSAIRCRRIWKHVFSEYDSIHEARRQSPCFGMNHDGHQCRRVAKVRGIDEKTYCTYHA